MWGTRLGEWSLSFQLTPSGLCRWTLTPLKHFCLCTALQAAHKGDVIRIKDSSFSANDLLRYFSKANREKMKESKMPIVKERGNNPRVLGAFMSFPPFGYTGITCILQRSMSVETAVLPSLAGYNPCIALAVSRVATYLPVLAREVRISRDVIILLYPTLLS